MFKSSEQKSLEELEDVNQTHLHVKDLLESLRIAVSKELDVVVHEDHWRLVRGHDHLRVEEKSKANVS